MKKSGIILLIFILLSLVGIGSTSAIVTLPTSNFSGNAQTTATVGSDIGSLTLVNVVISKVNYLDGTSTIVNTTNETIIGKTVTISGANRTGDYTFSNAIFTISDGSFTYFSATLSDIVFVTDGTKWYLNPALDVTNPATLNLTNIVLHTDIDHPSRYINELNSVKGINNAIGMKMILEVLSGNIEGNGNFNIFTGLIDGAPEVVAAPSGARSVGFWKTHDDEREAFINSAVSYSTVFTSASALRYYLTLTGKKPMVDKAKQQLAALLLNVASSLNISTVLNAGELEILQLINPVYGTGATVGDALTEIENSINGNTNLELAKDLADEINNRDHAE
jgi:hypothetical protein